MRIKFDCLRAQIIILISLVVSIGANNTTASWWQGIPHVITDILTMKMNIFTALPLELAATIIDTMCSSTLFMGSVPPQITPDIAKMHFQYMTPCLNYSVPFLESKKLWIHPTFRKNRKLVILATGWTNTVNASGTIAMISKAFMCRPGVNFVIVDTGSYVDTLYKWSALNTDPIGEHLAVGLHNLIKDMPWMDIHLIGHSLGAHIMGTAGRTFKKLSGQLVPRITGLDPAKPCFRYENALPGLMQGDASLVDVIHTNIGILAKREPLGDLDFYPGGAYPIKPGCLTIACSHTRAVEYFAESVYPNLQRSFRGIKCSSWTQLKKYRCMSNMTSTMGYIINRKARGIHYVDVNGWSPYGKAYIHSEQSHFHCVKYKC